MQSVEVTVMTAADDKFCCFFLDLHIRENKDHMKHIWFLQAAANLKLSVAKGKNLANGLKFENLILRGSSNK